MFLGFVQMSIATGLPLVGVLLRALPVRDGSGGSMDSLAPAYALVMFIMGTLVSWPQTHNSAMFSEACQPLPLRPVLYVIFCHSLLTFPARCSAV